MGALYALSTSIDLSVHHEYDRNLQLIETLDTRVNEDVLRLRYGFLGHYDGLVEDLDALRRATHRLAETPEFFEATSREELRESVREFSAVANEKALLVEHFKSANAALRSSLRYFPIVSRQLIAAAPPALAGRAGRLLDAVLVYEVSGAESDRAAARAAVDGLDELGPGASEDLAPLIDTTLVHARNVLLRRAQLDQLLVRLDAPTTRKQLADVQRRYDRAYTAAHGRAEQGRWLLFLLGTLTLAATAHTLRALARAKSQLELSNANLDRRVQERTAELTSAKAMLERDALLLRELNDELEASNRELDDFAYIASHDLKEPLRGIHNYAAFLIEDYSDALDEEGRKKLETLGTLSSRMDGLIDTLLHFSRVGRTELACGTADIQELVEGVVYSLHISLEERGVEIRIPEPLPSVYCDEVRVTEVFRNLISNALKYNDKPEKWIEIGALREAREADADKGRTTFYVRDNGIGIREKHLDSVFKLFKRLHGRDKYGGGTGAGLTIVKKIVERHGGRIWVESQQDEGTTFYFELGENE